MLREKSNLPARARVHIGSTANFSDGGSGLVSQYHSRAFVDTYAATMANALNNRKQHKIIEGFGENSQDLTPPLLENPSMNKKMKNLNLYIREKEGPITTSQFKLLPNITSKISMFSLTPSIDLFGLNQAFLDNLDDDFDEEYILPQSRKRSQIAPFIKITLKRSKEFLLFENKCLTVSRGTEEAKRVDDDNKFYEYITTGKGRIRRTNSSETQTKDVLYKTRDTNTQPVHKQTVESFVSNFEMFSAYKNIQSDTSSILLDNSSRMNVTTYKINGEDRSKDIFRNNNFKLATMVVLRLLAGNVFQAQQCRFRNMNPRNALTKSCEFKYSLQLLFRFNPQSYDRVRKAVTDLAFCPGNGDIIAVAYGIYSFEAMHVPENGYCCVWNIKNPANPERIFFYNVAVVSVQFSPYLPQLLAIGLYDGRVELRDISTFAEQPVAVSQRTETSTCDPITAIQWISQKNSTGAEKTEIDPLLALSEDGEVTKYRIINSPYFMAFKQIQLECVEGTVEGLQIQRDWELTQANRNPQGLNLVLHPSQDDIYYVLTNEGCLHKASINYPHQHLEVLQVHSGGVHALDFSPWSPKVFLTAGNDWCIRIWIDGMLSPLITLKHEIGPIHYAAWSKTHSTIIVANTREFINIWDIRRSTLRPVSSITVDKSHYTQFRFSLCGRSMAIGNERGQVLMLALEDMPFPPRFQYEELELALYKAISTDPELTTELKSFGYFGYPEHYRHHRHHHCSA